MASKILIRNLINDDISKIQDYWFDPPAELLASRDKMIDIKSLGSREELGERLKQSIVQESPGILIVEIEGKAIGMHSLTHIEKNCANMHAHYWDLKFVGKGLGMKAGALAALRFFENYDFDYLLLKPPLDNPMSTGLLRKTGLKKLGEEEYVSPITWPGLKVSVYKLFRKELEEYVQTLS